MDICILSERPITRAEIIVRAKVVGGLQMVDRDEADDKIIAVLANDDILAHAEDIRDLPEAIVTRLKHYFSTYKSMHDVQPVVIDSVYGSEQARRVVAASLEDYEEEFGRG